MRAHLIDRDLWTDHLWPMIERRFGKKEPALNADYFQILAPLLDNDQIKEATQSVVRHCRFFPSPQDFLDRAPARRQPGDPTGDPYDGETWSESMRRRLPNTIERHGECPVGCIPGMDFWFYYLQSLRWLGEPKRATEIEARLIGMGWTPGDTSFPIAVAGVAIVDPAP